MIKKFDNLTLEELKQRHATATGLEKQQLYHAIRYRENHDKILEHQNLYYQNNKDERLAYDKEYRDGHEEERAKYHKEHNEKNKIRVSAQHIEYEHAHESERDTYHYKYYLSHPKDYLERRRKRRALLASAEGSFTQEQFEALCKKQDYSCTYCSRDNTDLEPDHVTPLSRGGNNNIDNITPSCNFCNSSKNNKTYEAFVEWRKNLYPSKGVMPLVDKVEGV